MEHIGAAVGAGEAQSRPETDKQRKQLAAQVERRWVP
jgi:hypothetical protein